MMKKSLISPRLARALLLIPALIALIMALLAGCSQQVEETPYQLYFLAGTDVVYGEAIVGEDYYVAEGDYLTVANLLSILFAGPTDSSLENPFPSGTQLIWATWRSDGVLRVNLTEEYGGLTGIALTQADYCIVKTLCQIEGVTAVEILSASQENQFRNHSVLTLDDLA